MSKRNHRVFGTWGTDGTRVVNANWKAVLKWDKAAASEGPRRRVFPSLCDPFDEFVGWVLKANGDVQIDSDQAPGGRMWSLEHVRREFFRLIDETPNLDWLLLTKRPQNVWRMWEPTKAKPLPDRPVGLHESPHPQRRNNVWMGVSVSDQATADELIPELLKLRDLVPVLFVSVEPMLGPVNLHFRSDGLTMCERCCWGDRCDDPSHFHRSNCPHCNGSGWIGGIDWVIVGGESGPRARPCDAWWIRSIVDQCRAVDVPCFVKQLGANAVDGSRHRGLIPVEHYPAIHFVHAKGGDPSEWPSDLQVQEMPHVR